MQQDIWKERTELLIGAEAVNRLAAARVAVVGLGGVGAMAAEMLARAGVGKMVLVDSDVVSETNINRQLPALHSTVGKLKAEVIKERLQDINPAIEIDCVEEYVCEANISQLLGGLGVECVVDCIDTLSPKIALIQWCLGAGVPLVSSMGSGAKLDATAVHIADISKTYQCPLAHMLRKRLHHLGIHTGFTAVFSTEKPREGAMKLEESRNKKSQTGTISYLPAVFGCACAQASIARILGEVKEN